MFLAKRWIAFMLVFVLMFANCITISATETSSSVEDTEDVFVNVPKNGLTGFNTDLAATGGYGLLESDAATIWLQNSTATNTLRYWTNIASNVPAIIHMELAWEAGNGTNNAAGFTLNGRNSNGLLNIFRVTTDGAIQIRNSSEWQTISTIDKMGGTYTEIDLAINWQTYTAKVYVGGEVVSGMESVTLRAGLAAGITNRFEIGAATNAQGKMLIKDFCVYGGTELRDINANDEEDTSEENGEVFVNVPVNGATEFSTASADWWGFLNDNTIWLSGTTTDSLRCPANIAADVPTIIHMELAWEAGDGTGKSAAFSLNGRNSAQFPICRVTTGGEIQIRDANNGWTKVATIDTTGATYTEIDLVINWAACTAKVYVGGVAVSGMESVTLLPAAANGVTNRFDICNATGTQGKMLIKDFCVYEGTKLRDINAGNEGGVEIGKLFVNVPVQGLEKFQTVKAIEGQYGLLESDQTTLWMQSGVANYNAANTLQYATSIASDIPTVMHMELAWEAGDGTNNAAFWSLNGRNSTLNAIIRVTNVGSIEIRAVSGWKTIATIDKTGGAYTKIDLAIDWANCKAVVYINGEKTDEVTLVAGLSNGISSRFELATSTTAGPGRIFVKNLLVYEAEAPASVDEVLNASEKMGKLYLNTIKDGIKELSIDQNGNQISWETDHIVMKSVTGSRFLVSANLPYVAENMVIRMSLGWQGQIPNAGIEYQDANGLIEQLMVLDAQTNSILVEGEVVASIPAENTYLDIALAVDWLTYKADVYVGGTLVKEDIQLPTEQEGEALKSIRKVRPTLYEGNAAGATLLIKGWVIYEASVLHTVDASTEQAKNSLVDVRDDVALDALGSSVAMAINSDRIYYGGQLHDVGAAAIEEEDGIYFPAAAMETALGWTIDNKKTINGTEYISLEQLKVLANSQNSQVTYEERGYVVIGDASFMENSAKLLEVHHYLLYDRPDTTELASLLTNASHPRVMLNGEMLQEIKANYQNDETFREWADSLISNADAITMRTAPEYVITNGKLLSVSRDVYNRARKLGMAYLLTGEQKYVDAMYTVFRAVGEFPSWYTTQFLDTAEMITAVSIGYDWMYDAWTDEQKTYIETMLYSMGLKTAYEIYYTQVPGYYAWWIETVSNHNVVDNGSIAVGAITLYHLYPEECLELMEFAIRSVEVMYDEFYPSGAWSEGPMYWRYTLDYTINLFSTLQASFGTDFNLSNAPDLDETLTYFLAVNGPAGSNNYHDTESDGGISTNPLPWLGYNYEIPVAMNVRKTAIANGAEVTEKDLIFYMEEESGENKFPLDYYLKDIELVSLRGNLEDFESAWVSYHAGISVSSHSHLDTGTFVVQMLGQKWAIDLGSDSYSLPNYNQHVVYRKRPEGHNLYVINPTVDPNTYMGQELDANIKVADVVSKERGAYSWIDLTDAYDRDVSQAKRGYMLTDDRRAVLIRDEITFETDTTNEFYWFSHINADTAWEIVDNQTIILTQNGQQVKVMVDTDLQDYTLSVVDAVPLPSSPVVEGQNANAGIHKIQIHSSNATGSIYLQVKYIPLDDTNADNALANVAIADWSIPDGTLESIPVAPTLNKLFNNGEEMGDFSKKKLMYEVAVPYNAVDIPVVAALADEDCEIEITPAENFDGYTTVKVSRKDCPESFRIYRIQYKVLGKLYDIGEWTRYQIVNHSASAIPEENHPADKVSNNDLDTDSRWAAPDEAWICLDLGAVETIDAVALGWAYGDQRLYSFDLEVSEDGYNYVMVLPAQLSSGTTNDYEIFEFTKPVKARYVRYNGYGSNKSNWNSVTEFAVLTKTLKIEEVHTDTSYQLGSNNAVEILCNGALAGFEGLQIREGNGTYHAIDESMYIVEEGSTKITLSTEYLDSLATGDYTIKLMYTENRFVETALTVIADESESESESGNGSTGESTESESTESESAESESAESERAESESTESESTESESTESVSEGENTDGSEGGSAESGPATGDASNILLWSILAVVAGVALTGIEVYSRKRVM